MKGRTSMKARLGIASAVVVGGGAIGVAVVATGNHSDTSNAQSAAFSISQFHHTMSEGTALSTAMNELQWSQSKAMTTLAQMAPMRNFSMVWAGSRHNRTEYAAQRGIVELATKNFLIVKSSNGKQELWWLKGAKFDNVSSSTTGMVAMTGNNNATTAAMVNNNMIPVAKSMAGSTTAVNQMTAPVTKPTTITVSTGTETITITITNSTATVTSPTTATATPTATASVAPSPTATATKQPTWTSTSGVARGDLVMVTGERVHGKLIAKLVLFAAPSTTTPTATPSASVSVQPTATSTATATATPTVAPTSSTSVMPTASSSDAFSGKNS
jgi:hypothetical protein